LRVPLPSLQLVRPSSGLLILATLRECMVPAKWSRKAQIADSERLIAAAFQPASGAQIIRLWVVAGCRFGIRDVGLNCTTGSRPRRSNRGRAGR